MILAIDMGNTNVKIGLVKDAGSIIEERIMTDYDHTSFEYAEHIISVLTMYKVDRKDIEGAIVSSVVPPLTAVLSAAVNKVLGFRPMVVSVKLKTTVHFAKGVGADLIAAGEAAYTHYKMPCIVVNMGTATTMTVVNEEGIFLGGVILPGMKTSLNALARNAATLPEISLNRPGSAISLNTEECMRNGIIYGCAAQIDGIAARMEEELGKECTVVLTGGMARFCEPYCRHKVIRDSGLVMKGLLEIYRKNS